jgi:Uma2 family endonuclease
LDAEEAGYYVGAPDLAVEVFSPNDSPREVNDKARMWISFGVPLVWVVNPDTRSVDAHRPNLTLLTLTEDDTLDGGNVLPGFTCPVRDLFDL